MGRRLLALSSCLLLVGCMGDFGKLVEKRSWSRLKPVAPPISPDRVEIHYTFLEFDDPQERRDAQLWAEADEHVIPLDAKNSANANGIRLGKLGSRLPAELLELLESDGTGRLQSTFSGGLSKVEMTPVLDRWDLFTVENGGPQGEELHQAQGYLEITPTVKSARTILLSVQPTVEFGRQKQRVIPAPDMASWQYRTERDARSFPKLNVQLELTTGEYLLIGGAPDRPATVGDFFFGRGQAGAGTRRLLLIRALLPSTDELYHAGYNVDPFFAGALGPIHTLSRSPVRETVLAARRR